MSFYYHQIVLHNIYLVRFGEYQKKLNYSKMYCNKVKGNDYFCKCCGENCNNRDVGKAKMKKAIKRYNTIYP